MAPELLRRLGRHLVAAASLAFGTGHAAATAEIDDAVLASLAMRPGGAIRVILQLDAAPALDDLRAGIAALPRSARAGALAARLREPFVARQAPLLERLRGIGAQDLQPLWLEHAVSTEMPRSRVKEVAQWPGIRRIESDVALRGPTPLAKAHPRLAPLQDEQARAALARAAAGTDGSTPAVAAPAAGQAPWRLAEHLVAIDAARAWLAGLDGRGTTVAIVDSGVDVRVPVLAAAYRGGASDWLDPYGQHRLPHDALGHGTLVASLLVGRPAAGAAPAAVAPAARFVAARLFDDAGQGRLSAVHRIYQWLLDPDGDIATADAPQVVNNSWGLAGTTDRCNLRLARVWEAMALADVAVVFAAGNDGPHERTSMSPANNPGVVSVGALDADGAIARQSSRGPSACAAQGAAPQAFPTLHAPGVALPALDRIGASAGVAHRSDGTSFAAALASGALLLLRQREPGWTVPQLVQALARHAVAATPGGPPGVDAGALATAVPEVRPALGMTSPVEGRLDARSLRAVVPRALALQRIEGAGPVPAPGLELHGDAARWQPIGSPRDTSQSVDLVLWLSDGSRQPLRVVRSAEEGPGPAGEARVLASRRDTPVALGPVAPPATPGAAATAATGAVWSQPLRGGRIERDAEGQWWYRPPAGFIGTDQFALRTAEGSQAFKVVVRP